MNDLNKERISLFGAGGISGLIEVFFTHPIDVVKTKKQELKKLFHYSDVKPFSGITSRLVGIIPMRSVYWGTQAATTNYLTREYPEMPLFPKAVFVGITTGIAHTFVDCPIETHKIQKITQQKSNPSKINIDRKLFRGFMSTTYRNSIFASSFVSFHMIQPIPREINGTRFNNISYNILNSVCGSTLGVILSQPFDCIKTEKQRYYRTIYKQEGLEIVKKSTREMFSYLYNKNGRSLRVFYNGILARAIISSTSMGIGFLVFDSVKDVILSNLDMYTDH